MAIKPKNKTYLVLRDILAERIETGGYSPREKLPPERQLAEELNTTRLTLRDALSQLEVEGKVFRMDRRGWFIAGHRLKFDPVQDRGFMTNVSEQGFEPKTELLYFGEKSASPLLAKTLQIKEGKEVYHIQRKRFINNRPVLLEDIFLEKSRYPGLKHIDMSHSLGLVLREVYNAVIHHSDISIKPVAFNELHAKSLCVSPGTPALLINRISYNDSGEVIELDQEYWLSDVLQIEVRTNKT